MTVADLIRARKLVCPIGREPLVQSTSNRLVAGDKTYGINGAGVPLLLPGGEWKDAEVETVTQKLVVSPRRSESVIKKLFKSLVKSRWNPKAVKARRDLFSDESLTLINVGGGPGRVGKSLNMNIAPFSGVDIVGDAHSLPFADQSVDRINCEAVLEHLHDPNVAVQEMFRVLKPGGKIFCATPFLQHYHGYPHHYQNLTKTGQEHMFKKHGFHILESGVAVGAVDTLITLMAVFLLEIFPKNKLVWGFYLVLTSPLRPLDRLFYEHSDAHLLASVTYLIAEKPRN